MDHNIKEISISNIISSFTRTASAHLNLQVQVSFIESLTFITNAFPQVVNIFVIIIQLQNSFLDFMSKPDKSFLLNSHVGVKKKKVGKNVLIKKGIYIKYIEISYVKSNI